MGTYPRGTLGEGTVVSPADLIACSIQQEMVSGDTAPWGGCILINNCSEVCRVLVLSMYHLRARTGHHSLSCPTVEKFLREGMNT